MSTPSGGDLEVRIGLRRGGFELRADLTLPARGVTGVFGPSGSGKTSLLRAVAGLERGATGRIALSGEVWQDEEHGVLVPAHRRRVGYVFQEAALFSHRDVRGNLRFGYDRAPEHPVGWDEAVEWLGLGALLDRDPESLSGGERQRVATARALLAGPRLLLLDEPLSALDEPGRREIFPYLERLVRRVDLPVLYVSHALEEVARLSDRMVWLEGGRVRAMGPTVEVVGDMDFARWRGALASVVVPARVAAHDDENHLTELEGPWGTIRTRRVDRAPGAEVRLQVHARDVSLARGEEGEASSILNEFPVTVLEVAEQEPGEVLARLTARSGSGPVLLSRITRLSRDRLDVRPGAELWARVKSVAVVE